MSQTDNTPTEIYLDMDGVLADFFAEYAKLAGVTTGSYRDIPPAKVDPTLDKMIGTDFFARLPMFKTVPQLLKLVLSYTDHYNICSSPLRGDNKNSEKHKRVWISKHLNPLPKDIIITGRKPKWATQPDGTPNILIDDRGKNIRDWIAAGGYGIKYQADEDSLETIKMGLDRFFRGDVQEPQDSDLMVSTRVTQEPKETYKRSELPQVTKEHLNYIPHAVETVDLEVVCPVQKELVTENLQKQYKRLTENRFAPIVVDKNYRIINGHHRYEVLKQLNSGYAEVARIPLTLEEVKTVMEKWSAKYKKSIDCSNPKGFSQKAHCAGRKKKNENIEESIIVEHPAVIAALAAAGVTIRELVKRYGFNAVKKALDKAKTQKPNLQKPANDHGGYVDDLLKAVNKKRTPDEIARAQQINFPRALDNAKAMIRHASKDLKAGKLSREEFTNIMRYLRVNFKRKTGKELPIDDLLKVVENFADGKKKGKSRPGRVKRAGASCKGSVTSLRKKAKNASGEKAKMYHWCANMKSGRKKG
jgi:hypothetical protein